MSDGAIQQHSGERTRTIVFPASDAGVGGTEIDTDSNSLFFGSHVLMSVIGGDLKKMVGHNAIGSF